jgi:uncharacterized RDD family membrane protein YckC
MFTELIKKRIIAYLIDGVVISTPLYIVGIIYWDYILKAQPNQILNFALFLQFVPAILYFFISELFFDKTLGKKILKLKIIQTDNKNKFITFFIRTISRLIPLDLATFLIFENELLHDKISKTKVVENI